MLPDARRPDAHRGRLAQREVRGPTPSTPGLSGRRPLADAMGEYHAGGNRPATEAFYAALTGAVPLPVFMDPANIGRILAQGSA